MSGSPRSSSVARLPLMTQSALGSKRQISTMTDCSSSSEHDAGKDRQCSNPGDGNRPEAPPCTMRPPYGNCEGPLSGDLVGWAT